MKKIFFFVFLCCFLVLVAGNAVLNSESDSSNKGFMSLVIGWGKSIMGEVPMIDEAPMIDEDNNGHVIQVQINIGGHPAGMFFSTPYSNKRLCNEAMKQMYVAATNGSTLSATCKMDLGTAYGDNLNKIRLYGVTYMGYQQKSTFSTYALLPMTDLNECKLRANKLRGPVEKEPSAFSGIYFCLPEQWLET